MNMKYLPHVLCAVVLTISGGAAEEAAPQKDAMADCPMHAQHISAAAAKGVDERGDQGMGFSHGKTTHHFRLLADGGAIEVTANDAVDRTSRDQIRVHLAQIAQVFTAGNFETPLFVHARVPDGVPVMQQMKERIQYRYEELETGGRVRIATADGKALAAIHAFLRFQIQDHRTGDESEVSAQ